MKIQKKELKILRGKEREKIIKMLNEQFGIKNVPGKLIKRGKEKIYLFTGNFSEKEILNLSQATFIEGSGIYMQKK